MRFGFVHQDERAFIYEFNQSSDGQKNYLVPGAKGLK